MASSKLERFIRGLPESPAYSRRDLMVDALKLGGEPSRGLVVYDAPAGWINPEARIALVGVTPGFTQMEIIFRETRRHLLSGASFEDARRQAKYAASFAGSMRPNLVRCRGRSRHHTSSCKQPGIGFGNSGDSA